MTDEVRMTLRLPRAVREAAGRLAAREERSLNWLIVDALRRRLGASSPLPGTEPVREAIERPRSASAGVGGSSAPPVVLARGIAAAVAAGPVTGSRPGGKRKRKGKR